MQPIGVFGGTFDPIHYGHLRTAFELWQELQLAEVRFLPTGSPPHRDHLLRQRGAAAADGAGGGRGSAGASWSMTARCAAAACPIRSIRSWSCGREYPHRSLCLLLGMDAFLGLPNWHRWRELLELAHIVVAHRPGWRAPTTGPLGEVMVDHGTGACAALHAETGRARLCPRRDAAGDLLHGTARSSSSRVAIRAIWFPTR